MVFHSYFVVQRAVVFICHGVDEHIERHSPLASTLTEKGLLVVGHDHGMPRQDVSVGVAGFL